MRAKLRHISGFRGAAQQFHVLHGSPGHAKVHTACPWPKAFKNHTKTGNYRDKWLQCAHAHMCAHRVRKRACARARHKL
jgi:hypothetical protein